MRRCGFTVVLASALVAASLAGCLEWGPEEEAVVLEPVEDHRSYQEILRERAAARAKADADAAGSANASTDEDESASNQSSSPTVEPAPEEDSDDGAEDRSSTESAAQNETPPAQPASTPQANANSTSPGNATTAPDGGNATPATNATTPASASEADVADDDEDPDDAETDADPDDGIADNAETGDDGANPSNATAAPEPSPLQRVEYFNGSVAPSFLGVDSVSPSPARDIRKDVRVTNETAFLLLEVKAGSNVLVILRDPGSARVYESTGKEHRHVIDVSRFGNWRVEIRDQGSSTSVSAALSLWAAEPAKEYSALKK